MWIETNKNELTNRVGVLRLTPESSMEEIFLSKMKKAFYSKNGKITIHLDGETDLCYITENTEVIK